MRQKDLQLENLNREFVDLIKLYKKALKGAQAQPGQAPKRDYSAVITTLEREKNNLEGRLFAAEQKLQRSDD